jgi:hypothetical protein
LGDIQIGSLAFFDCISLINITIYGNLSIGSDNIFNNLNKNINIYYYGSKYVDYIQFYEIDIINIFVCSYYHNSTFGGHNIIHLEYCLIEYQNEICYCI